MLHRAPTSSNRLNRISARSVLAHALFTARRQSPFRLGRGVGAQLVGHQPSPNFKTHRQTVSLETIQIALSEQILDVGIAERKARTGPKGVPNDCGGELAARERDREAPPYRRTEMRYCCVTKLA
jgi:hypothetical protein